MYVKFVTHSYVWFTRDSKSELVTPHIHWACDSYVCRVRDSFLCMIYKGLQIRVGDSTYVWAVSNSSFVWVMSHCSWLTHTKSMIWLTLPSHFLYVWVMSHCSWLTCVSHVTLFVTHTYARDGMTHTYKECEGREWVTNSTSSSSWLTHIKSVREEWVDSLFPHTLYMCESWRAWRRVRDSFSSLTLFICVSHEEFDTAHAHVFWSDTLFP